MRRQRWEQDSTQTEQRQQTTGCGEGIRNGTVAHVMLPVVLSGVARGVDAHSRL